MSPAVTRHCPYLGLESDPNSIESAPTRAHCCYALVGPESIALEHQQRYCLSREHPACPIYRCAVPEPTPARAEMVAPRLAVAAEPSEAAEPEERARGSWFDRIVMLVTVAALLFAIIYFGALFFERSPASAENTPPTPVTRLASATPRNTPTPTSIATARPTQVAIAETSARLPAPTAPPGSQLAAINPALDGGGWVASNERAGNHLGDSLIRAGILDKTIYFGLLQFDLSTIPAGSQATFAALELTGARTDKFSGTGQWQVKLITVPAAKRWATLSFDEARDLQWDFVLTPGLSAGQLGEGKANRLEFSGPALGALERQFGQGRVSFRIEGPVS